MQGGGRWFRVIAFLCLRSRRERGNWLLEGTRHTQRAEEGRNIGRECHLRITGVEHTKLAPKFFYKHTTNLYWCLQLEQDGLVYEDFSCLCAEILDFVLRQLHRLSRAVATHYE